jgi:hypothetical protein
MGMRYRKTVKVGPFRATVSKSGVSYSAGVPGARVTKRADGKVQTTLSAPKTGVSYTHTSRSSKPSAAPRPAASRPVARPAQPAKAAPAAKPVKAAKPARVAKPPKPPKPAKPLPGIRSTIPPRPPWGWVTPRVFKGRYGTVSITEQGIYIDRDTAGRVGNHSAGIWWRDVVAVDFLEPQWGRLGHVHFVTAAEPRGQTVLGRGSNPAAGASRNPHAMQLSSRQRADFEELRRFIGG